MVAATHQATAVGSATLARVADHLTTPGAGVTRVSGVRGGFAALALAELHRRIGRPLVIVVPDEARAGVLEDGLNHFLPRPDPDAGGLPLDPAEQLSLLEHIPFQGMSPSRVQILERVDTLFRVVNDLGLRAIVVPAAALLDRVIPRMALEAHAFEVRRGALLDRERLVHFLVAAGYHRVPAVEDVGTFAVRGGLIDVFAPLADRPVRIDLWDDEVDTLRMFDPTTQRTDEAIDHILLGPVREIVFTHATIQHARGAILDLADERNIPTTRARAIVEDVDAGILAIGMEDLLPLFHARLDTIFEVLDVADPLWVVEEPERCRAVLGERWEDLARRAAARLEQRGELALPAERRYVPAADAMAALDDRAALTLEPFETAEAALASDAGRFHVQVKDHHDLVADIARAMHEGSERVLSPLIDRVRAWRKAGKVVVACAHTDGGLERLHGLIRHYGVAVRRHDARFTLAELDRLTADPASPSPARGPLALASHGHAESSAASPSSDPASPSPARGPLALATHGHAESSAGSPSSDPADLHIFLGTPGEGFHGPDLGLVLLDEHEILGKPPQRRRRRNRVPPEHALQSWRDLKDGDAVVHLWHGIGRYQGMVKKVIDGIESDLIVLEYADGDRLFVPVEKLHLVSKHQGSDNTAPRVDKLGGTRWERAQKKARSAVRDIADQLLKLYAEREAAEGYAFSPPEGYYHSFEAAFPYEETPDQGKAIDAVIRDMQRERPMDRLVCGDVGFGKTEVALRAAFKAVLDAKQVAVLVPTQVLAEQHKVSFERRFEGFPVRTETLSRLKTASEQRDTLKDLAAGRIDVIIGTHRLLSKDVRFRDLGLVIIDEEHRFGVAQKERLKAYRASVDILTLTATPIPRTLHMALAGLRDVSLIHTPPTDRLPIRTLVSQPSEDVISGAIRREMARGGQVFYVHNRVADIAKHAELVQRLVPEARILVGHGQMREGDLEKVMTKFVRGEAHVLISTTIIESGLDIAAANTMIIDRADTFGLAQLHQLRGRIGRSSERAYCYLLVPSPGNLAGDAKERIQAIQRFSELGSGFSIASYDLDIRGAGDILGADQAGNIDAVGYDAYMDMLRQAVEEQRAAEQGITLAPELEVDLKIAVEGRIPESWLPDATLRLRLYRDLAAASTLDELLERFREAIDRYGRAPAPVQNLVDLLGIKLEAKRLGVASVAYGADRLVLGLSEHGQLSGSAVAALLSAPDNRFRRQPSKDGQLRLARAVTHGEWAAGLETVRESLRWMAKFASRGARV